MSETTADARTSQEDEQYTPFIRVGERRYRAVEFVCLLLAGAGMYLRGGTLGIALGLVLILLWTAVRVEFVFAFGAVLFSGLGESTVGVPLRAELTSYGFDPASVAIVLLLGGIGGVLALDLLRTWKSVTASMLFSVTFVLAAVGIAYASVETPLHLIGLTAAVGIAVTGYGLYQYSRIRFERVTADRFAPNEEEA